MKVKLFRVQELNTFVIHRFTLQEIFEEIHRMKGSYVGDNWRVDWMNHVESRYYTLLD